jgi:hypothetical protein
MPLYFIKPVVWNSLGYSRPGGGRFVSGYPKDNGYGHEEWNNSTRLNVTYKGERVHIFHTEALGNQDVDSAAGDVFVFMVASFQGKQFLVAVAGSATALFGDQHRKERLKLLSQIEGADEFPGEAWAQATVRLAFNHDERRFRSNWREERQWLANWFCRQEMYLGLHKPVELDAGAITGKKRLVTMYGTYQAIERPVALKLLDRIPSGAGPALAALKAAAGHDGVDVDYDLRVLQSEGENKTTQKSLINARLGQGKFRADLNEIWGSACAVTGCSVPEVLRASHIKPWRSSTDKERLNPDNGLLLAAHLDSLFDAGLITFSDTGSMILSPVFRDDGRPKMALEGKLRKPPSASMKAFLDHHRTVVFRSLPAA